MPLAPLNTPVPVTSFDQFKNNFGDFQAGNKLLAHAMFGFFQNGGARCHVMRVADLTNAGDITAALKEFEAIDEIAMVAVPGALTADVQKALIDHCELLGDRFAILDGQRTTTITVAAIQGTVADSNYAALYFPWVQVVIETPDRRRASPTAGARALRPAERPHRRHLRARRRRRAASTRRRPTRRARARSASSTSSATTSRRARTRTAST